MGTLTITSSGFAATPASAPAGWPAGITWPASATVNGTKTYTINDADLVSLLTWAAATTITPNLVTPPTPTALQVLVNWLQIWVNGTKNAVQQFFTPVVAAPSQITIT